MPTSAWILLGIVVGDLVLTLSGLWKGWISEENPLMETLISLLGIGYFALVKFLTVAAAIVLIEYERRTGRISRQRTRFYYFVAIAAYLSLYLYGIIAVNFL